MKTIQAEAVYEHGTLKPAQRLPLQEGQRVVLTIHLDSAVERLSGLLPWNGDPGELERFLEDPDEGMWGGRDI